MKYMYLDEVKNIFQHNSIRGLCGAIFLILILLFFITCIALFIYFIIAIFGPVPTSDNSRAVEIRKLGLSIAALIGLPFLIWRTVISSKQVEVSDRAHFNERLNDAGKLLSSQIEKTTLVKQNGSQTVLKELKKDLVARVSAIDNLESLSLERPSTSRRIAMLLATYVRGNFPAENLKPSKNIQVRRTPPPDLQKAIDCLGRIYRQARKSDSGEWRLDLSGSNLDGVNFNGGYFYAVNLTRSRCEGAFFRDANFEGAIFYASLLNYGDFMRCNMKGSRFDHSIINEPKPVMGGMVESINFADIEGATFIKADISALDYIGTEKEIERTFGTSDTVVSSEIKRQMPDANTHRIAFNAKRSKKKLNKAHQTALDKLISTGFSNWQPYASSDMITGHNLKKFQENLGINTWPYTG